MSDPSDKNDEGTAMSNPIKALALVAALCVAGLSASPGAAAESPSRGAHAAALEQVRVPLTVEGWVKTETARVDVTGDLTLVSGNRAEARGRALAGLASAAPGAEWRVVRFTRRTDASGAERWTFGAFARLKQETIDGLAGKLDALKKPGLVYRIAAIRMTPTLAEIESARASLRRRLYGLARQEAANAQGLWPGRKVRVVRVDFTPHAVLERQKAEPLRMAMTEAAQAPAEAPMAVERRLRVSAVVTLMPEPPLEGGAGGAR